MARSKKMIPRQVEKAFRLQESLFADNELLMKIAGTLLSSWSHLGILPHCLSWVMLTVCKKDAAEQQRYYLKGISEKQVV